MSNTEPEQSAKEEIYHLATKGGQLKTLRACSPTRIRRAQGRRQENDRVHTTSVIP